MERKRNLVVILLMMLCVFACSKGGDSEPQPEPPTPEVEENPRIITLKMLLPDRATRASVEEPVTSVGAIVNGIDIYFYDEEGGVITAKFSLSEADIDEISSGTGLSFPNIDPITDGVIVIANDDVNKEISADAGQDVYTELFPKLMDVEHEQAFNNVTFYGKSTTFVAYTPPNPETDVDYYATQITIKPLVARLEISGLEVTSLDAAGSIQSVSLQNIFMDNIYQYVGIDHNNAAINTPDPIVSGLFISDTATVESNPDEWWIYSYLTTLPLIPANNPANTFSPDVADPTVDGDGVFAFHFIPSDETPWVRLRIRTGANPRDLYINVKGFIQNGVPIVFKSGFIYKMTLPFAEGDMTQHIDNELDVTVQVTVQNWTIINGILPE